MGFLLHKQTSGLFILKGGETKRCSQEAGSHDLRMGAQCMARDGSEGVSFQRSMHSFISAGREAENFEECFQTRRPCLRGVLCDRDSGLDSLTLIFPPSSGTSLSDTVGAHNRPTVY